VAFVVNALVLFVAPRGVEKAGHEWDGVGFVEVTFEVDTMRSSVVRGRDEAAASSGTLSSPETEQGSPL
jgi:hypothetical protein